MLTVNTTPENMTLFRHARGSSRRSVCDEVLSFFQERDSRIDSWRRISAFWEDEECDGVNGVRFLGFLCYEL